MRVLLTNDETPMTYLVRFLKDRRGTSVIEYAGIAALIHVIAFAGAAGDGTALYHALVR